MNSREICRQFIHLSGIGAVFFAYSYGSLATGIGALFLCFSFFFFSFYIRWKEKIRERLPIRVKKLEQLEDSVHELVNSFERESAETNYMGAILFFLAIGAILLIFPFKIAILSIIVLSVGDSLSTLVGVHFGKHRTKINPKKSWEGTVGGFLAALAVCLLFTNPPAALVAAGIGMFMELMPIRINDNLLMPFSVGIVLWGLSSLGLVV
jgi:dolichol kinase